MIKDFACPNSNGYKKPEKINISLKCHYIVCRWQDFEQHEGYRDDCFGRRSELSWFQPSPQRTHNRAKWKLLDICTFPCIYRERRKEKVWEKILQATRCDKEGEDVLQVVYQSFPYNSCWSNLFPCSVCTWPHWNKYPFADLEGLCSGMFISF